MLVWRDIWLCCANSPQLHRQIPVLVFKGEVMMVGNSGRGKYRIRNSTKGAGTALFLGGGGGRGEGGRQHQGSKDFPSKPGCPAQHNTSLGAGIEAKPTQMRN